MERIVSLIPSSTEIACALGFEAELVGRSHECDFPPGIERLPSLTEPKLDTDATSAAIDGRVKQLVGDGLSVYRVDIDKLRELRPTVILTQDQCEVCAVSLRDVEEALGDWLDEPPRLISLSPNRLGDVWGDFERVATALGEAQRGRDFAASLSNRLAEISEQALRIRAKPSVACVEWIDPLMSAGNWMPELVTLAGGRPLFGETGTHSPWLEWETLRNADPEIIILLPCGFDIERTRRELDPLTAKPGWAELEAVRSGRVFVADGNQYFNRPGPRLVESLEILAEILHPDHFAPRHQDVGWQTL
jgi:iron complex transport system substrate-binding protein